MYRQLLEYDTITPKGTPYIAVIWLSGRKEIWPQETKLKLTYSGVSFIAVKNADDIKIILATQQASLLLVTTFDEVRMLGCGMWKELFRCEMWKIYEGENDNFIMTQNTRLVTHDVCDSPGTWHTSALTVFIIFMILQPVKFQSRVYFQVFLNCVIFPNSSAVFK